MKSRTLLAVAVASALFASGAYAGGVGDSAGGVRDSARGSHSTEVQTPSSVSESAPWLAGQPHLAGWSAADSMSLALTDELSGDRFTGASLGAGGSGSVGSEPLIIVEQTEYWLIGDETGERSVGASSSLGGAGSVGFDSSMSGSESQRHRFDSSSATDSGASEIVVYTPAAEMILQSVGDETPLLSEHYLVSGPLSSFDGSSFLVLAIAPSQEDLALLDSLKEDFFIMTPAYGEG
jgi:hypothetical protein